MHFTSKPAISSNETLAPPSTISSRISEASFDSTPLMPVGFKVRLFTEDGVKDFPGVLVCAEIMYVKGKWAAISRIITETGVMRRLAEDRTDGLILGAIGVVGVLTPDK